MASKVNIDELRTWVGRQEEAVDYVTVPMVHRANAMLDRADALPRIGEPLPIGWHAFLFPRVVRHSEVGADGHPKRGDFLPPVPLPRRMFAGKRVTFHADLKVGDEVRKVSTIEAVDPKVGRTGELVFLKLRHEMSTVRGLAITEEQNIVYRDTPAGDARAPEPASEPPDAQWEQRIQPDPVLLFRFSALTFNGHRIHYDLPYVTGEEGYPGLIVNGGLTTLFVFELARRHAPRPIGIFESRNVRPLFVQNPLFVRGIPNADGTGVRLWAADHTGALALTAEARYASADGAAAPHGR
ncbi:MAG: MaoC family dehydratase N-terminal domain-containing protein [Proteobacteria bacterium]|nr:MaoC family dehydratase N-terminal domain-containing protein [Burkholderiales bacterium]